MKKRTIATLMALMLLAGCETQAPAAPSATDTPDMEAIIQQSVDEAVQEKIKEYEEEQKKKDEEITRLKDRLEDLTGQSEVPPEESSSAPTEDASSQAPASSQSAAPASSSQAEIPPQPEPEPAPSPSSASAYDPYDLKNMYPGFVWENITGEAEEETYTAGCLREEAEEAIRLANLERENHGLDPLPLDEDLMELAEIRAEETRTLYSHTRPDGTNVGAYRCGENIGRKYSAEEQVTSWMNSEGHRTNILLERYHHIGAACYQAENGNYYWVMVFSLD